MKAKGIKQKKEIRKLRKRGNNMRIKCTGKRIKNPEKGNIRKK